MHEAPLATPEPLFPEWVNRVRPWVGVLALAGLVYLVVLVYAAGSPETTDVGYSPRQPVPYSHQLHVGKMGMDCRYCHTTVEGAAFAAVPPTSVCMNCHRTIAPDSDKLAPLRQSMQTGKSVPWVRVHDLPDYVYFDHHAHVTRNVACISCHGRIDCMEQVYQAKKLSMGWCLECHREPAPNLRPAEHITDMNWLPETDPIALGRRLMKEKSIAPSTDCSTCHR
jgi:menaquinone reductase, multiheme cytochrome c subunit